MQVFRRTIISASLLDLSTFVVEQKRKFFEMRSQYRIFDETGSQIGSVEQRTQSALAFLARLGTDLDVVDQQEDHAWQGPGSRSSTTPVRFWERALAQNWRRLATEAFTDADTYVVNLAFAQ